MKIPFQPPDPEKGPQMADYYNKYKCTWCDGCGNYGIWTALKRALVELGLHPWQVLICFDIGCHGNGSDKMRGYRFHGLHGRVLPFAAGAKLANGNVPVIAVGGDGASFSEGVGHLVHSIRSNYPITFILHNNANYGLTTGQASATTWQDQPMNSSPNGIPERTLPSMEFIFSLGPTFVARGFSGNIKQLTEIFKAAIQHQKYGFAFVDVLQACPTYNKFATHKYLLDHVYDVSIEGLDTSDLDSARNLAVDTSVRIATGVLYQTTEVLNFAERLKARRGISSQPVDEVFKQDVSKLMKALR